MNEKKRDKDQPVDPDIDSAKETEQVPEDGASGADDIIAEMAESDPLSELAAENEDLRDRLLRAMAETENVRKRSEREKAEATLYAATNFARDMLSVGDNLTRALAAVSEQAREEADENMKNLIAGIEITHKELLNCFAKHGITLLDPIGEKFDPNFHQAMFEVPGSGEKPGTVVEVVQSGYKIGERVLRPAMVGVAKDDAPADARS